MKKTGEIPCGGCGRGAPFDGDWDPARQCRMCWLAANNRTYARYWGLERRLPPAMRLAAGRGDSRLECIHRGREAGRHKCPSCRGNVEIKLFTCGIHGKCHISDKAVDGVTGCRGCLDRRPPGAFLSFAPGEADPLPAPRAEPVPKDWAKHPPVIKAHQEAWKLLLDTPPAPPPAGSGAGVLYVLNDKRFWVMLQASVKMLRRVSDLPVEIWHDHLSNFTNDLAGVPGIAFRAAKDHRPRSLGGWELKTLAQVHCPFSRILYLDADAYPVADPAPLLNSLTPGHPLAFWEDLEFTKDNLKWEAFGQAPAPVPPVQGGQVAMIREHAWPWLRLAHWANQHSDYAYSYMFGDQDAWKLALGAAEPSGVKYNCLGKADWRHPGFVCSFGGQPLFVHRCQGKVHPRVKYERTFHLPGDDLYFRHIEESELMRGAQP